MDAPWRRLRSKPVTAAIDPRRDGAVRGD